ncbi:hypothetical protein phytr_9060 [Candidatus Phycorickettsia trachydisci]|uniref:Uncharacterized protein n=1 Tax=Candidatus Phycorickettsia trachydisci TaxID=2115978 RepID=A0A2P1P9A2_9RICK|nr:hypothetical protein [Candidatus Phycorickettsia trachydisci]AVP87835.1 hypothetical protein phytr_9060 [Candidatus Phycorickettsia trachydisci]
MSSIIRVESGLRSSSAIDPRDNDLVQNDSLSNISFKNSFDSSNLNHLSSSQISDDSLTQVITPADSEESNAGWTNSVGWVHDKLAPTGKLLYQAGKKLPILTLNGLNIIYEYKQLTKHKDALDKNIFPSIPEPPKAKYEIASWVSPSAWYTYWTQSNNQSTYTSGSSNIMQNPFEYLKDVASDRINTAADNFQKMNPIELGQIGSSLINLGHGVYNRNWLQAGVEVFSIGKKTFFKKKDPNEKFKEIKLTEHIDGFTALNLANHISDGADSFYKIYKSTQNILGAYSDLSPLASEAYLGIKDLSKTTATKAYDKGTEVYDILKDGIKTGSMYDAAQELLIGEYDSISQEFEIPNYYHDDLLATTSGNLEPWEHMYGVSGA